MSNILNLINIVNHLNNHNDLSQILNRTFVEQEDILKPCSASFVDKLEKVIITNEDIDNNLCCAICQDSFKLGEKVIKLPCKDPHFFHYEANEEDCGGILPWLKEHNSCPICREEFPLEENIDIPVPDENFDEATDDENNEEQLLEQSRDQIIENIIERMFNNMNRSIELQPRPIELQPRPIELQPRPIELNPNISTPMDIVNRQLRFNILPHPIHFNTINLRPLNILPENYDPDLQEAIRRSLDD
jgi:hypothetical protein